LVVQEGQTATVALTQDVVTEINETTTNVAGGGAVTAREFTVEPAGLILQIDVDD
jgi:type IV pilus assembly protein PilQ